MNDAQKSMIMPKETLELWLEALRSGKFTQGHGCLYDKNTKGFCCLGVLQYVVSGGKIEVSNRDELIADVAGGASPNDLFECAEFANFPSKKWLRENNIEFYKMMLPNKTQLRKSGSSCLDPVLKENPDDAFSEMCASDANDTENLSFKEIADLIEAATIVV